MVAEADWYPAAGQPLRFSSEAQIREEFAKCLVVFPLPPYDPVSFPAVCDLGPTQTVNGWRQGYAFYAYSAGPSGTEHRGCVRNAWQGRH